MWRRRELKDAGLLSDVLTVFLRAVFALQRRRARRQGIRRGQVGAVSLIQFFGSALQVTPHFHSLVPDGVFVPREGGVCFEALPPPTQDEVERLLRVVHLRVLRLLEKRGALPAQGPEDALRAYQAHSLQQRLRWTEWEGGLGLGRHAQGGCMASAPARLTARPAPVSGPPRPLCSSPPPQHGLSPAYTLAFVASGQFTR
jgi:hypothetical protein